MKLKDFTNAVVAGIDKKLERFDPKWQAAHGKGGLRSRYEDKTGIARYREWRGVRDTLVDYAAWLNNLLAMGKMVASAPVPILKGFWEYRWMGSYLGTFAFIDRLFEGYRDEELKIAHMNMHCIVNSLTKKIALVLANDRRLGGGKLSDNIVPMDEVMPPLFMSGFKNLIPIPIQTLPEFIICDIDQHLEPHYIDVAESFGLAADVCSRCSAETGVAIDDDFPMVGRAVLTTNMPCNASEATSMFQRRVPSAVPHLSGAVRRPAHLARDGQEGPQDHGEVRGAAHQQLPADPPPRHCLVLCAAVLFQLVHLGL